MNNIATGANAPRFVRVPETPGASAGISNNPPLDRRPPGLLTGGNSSSLGSERPPPVGGDTTPTPANSKATADASAASTARSAASDINTNGAQANQRPAGYDPASARPVREDFQAPQSNAGNGNPVSNRDNRLTPDGSAIRPQNPSGEGSPAGNARPGVPGGQCAQGNNGVGTQVAGGGGYGNAHESSRAAASAQGASGDRSGGNTSGAGNAAGQPGGPQPAGGSQTFAPQGPGSGQPGAHATDISRWANTSTNAHAGPPAWAAAAGSSKTLSSAVGGVLSGVGGLVGSLIRAPQPLFVQLGANIVSTNGGFSSAMTAFGGSFPGLPLAGGIANLSYQSGAQSISSILGLLAPTNPAPSSMSPGATATAGNAAHAQTVAPSRPEALMTPGAGNQSALPGVLAVARSEKAMAAHNALLVASQNANAPVRAGTANLLSMAGSNAGVNALAGANLPRNVGAAIALGAGQQVAATVVQSLPAGQRLQTMTAGPGQARADAPAVAGGNQPGNRPGAGNVATQAGAAPIAAAATQAAAASTLAALAATGAVSGELGAQSREAQIAVDREREQAQPVDRSQMPMHVFAADVGRQARPAKLEKTSMLGRLLSVLSGSRGEGAINAPDKPLSNTRMKSTQTMMWVFATVAFGSVAAGMTVFWNSGALGVLATPSAQALTLFALIGVAAGGAFAAWRAVTGAESPPPDASEATPREPPGTRAIGQDDKV